MDHRENFHDNVRTRPQQLRSDLSIPRAILVPGMQQDRNNYTSNGPDGVFCVEVNGSNPLACNARTLQPLDPRRSFVPKAGQLIKQHIEQAFSACYGQPAPESTPIHTPFLRGTSTPGFVPAFKEVEDTSQALNRLAHPRRQLEPYVADLPSFATNRTDDAHRQDFASDGYAQESSLQHSPGEISFPASTPQWRQDDHRPNFDIGFNDQESSLQLPPGNTCYPARSPQWKQDDSQWNNIGERQPLLQTPNSFDYSQDYIDPQNSNRQSNVSKPDVNGINRMSLSSLYFRRTPSPDNSEMNSCSSSRFSPPSYTGDRFRRPRSRSPEIRRPRSRTPEIRQRPNLNNRDHRAREDRRRVLSPKGDKRRRSSSSERSYSRKGREDRRDSSSDSRTRNRRRRSSSRESDRRSRRSRSRESDSGRYRRNPTVLTNSRVRRNVGARRDSDSDSSAKSRPRIRYRSPYRTRPPTRQKKRDNRQPIPQPVQPPKNRPTTSFSGRCVKDNIIPKFGNKKVQHRSPVKNRPPTSAGERGGTGKRPSSQAETSNVGTDSYMRRTLLKEVVPAQKARPTTSYHSRNAVLKNPSQIQLPSVLDKYYELKDKQRTLSELGNLDFSRDHKMTDNLPLGDPVRSAGTSPHRRRRSLLPAPVYSDGRLLSPIPFIAPEPAVETASDNSEFQNTEMKYEVPLTESIPVEEIPLPTDSLNSSLISNPTAAGDAEPEIEHADLNLPNSLDDLKNYGVEIPGHFILVENDVEIFRQYAIRIGWPFGQFWRVFVDFCLSEEVRAEYNAALEGIDGDPV